MVEGAYQGCWTSYDLAFLVVLRPMAGALEFVLSVVPGDLQGVMPSSSHDSFNRAAQCASNHANSITMTSHSNGSHGDRVSELSVS